MTSEEADQDVIILGGGPGGLSAALWCAELGLNAILLEREIEPGGQLLRTFNAIKNHLGIEARDGREMRDIFLRQVEERDVTIRCGSAIAVADLAKKEVVLADGSQLSAQAMIIATGVSRRKLGVPGEDEFRGRGILASGQTSLGEVRGKKVLIIGGGDAALENALILSGEADRVFVVHRREQLSGRAEFRSKCGGRDNIEFILNTTATAIEGNKRVETVELKSVTTGAPTTLSVDAVLIRIGEVPNTGWFAGQAAIDQAGFLVVDHYCATNVDRVYAVGDVANPVPPTISSAVGMGATAARSIAIKSGYRNGHRPIN